MVVCKFVLRELTYLAERTGVKDIYAHCSSYEMLAFVKIEVPQRKRMSSMKKIEKMLNMQRASAHGFKRRFRNKM